MIGADAHLSLDTWSEPLPPEERDELLERVALIVAKRGLEAPAIWAIEMHKPLAFLGAQTLIVGAPFLGPVIGLERMQKLSRLLAEDGAVEALVARIEEKATERDAQRTKPPAETPSESESA